MNLKQYERALIAKGTADVKALEAYADGYFAMAATEKTAARRDAWLLLAAGAEIQLEGCKACADALMAPQISAKVDL